MAACEPSRNAPVGLHSSALRALRAIIRLLVYSYRYFKTSVGLSRDGAFISPRYAEYIENKRIVIPCRFASKEKLGLRSPLPPRASRDVLRLVHSQWWYYSHPLSRLTPELQLTIPLMTCSSERLPLNHRKRYKWAFSPRSCDIQNTIGPVPDHDAFLSACERALDVSRTLIRPYTLAGQCPTRR